MNLRPLRCFIVVAEELHFSRAAERLHIDQSPLSRIIKNLESDLGVALFERTSRSTHLTDAGKAFLDDARLLLLALEQAKASARSAAIGYRGTLRIALSDGTAQARTTALLALCREEEPDIEIRLFEVPFAQQLRGLRTHIFDAGFALASEVDETMVATAVWQDPMIVAVPTRHPLLAHKQIPLDDVVNYPLVLSDPEKCEGYHQQLEQMLSTTKSAPIVAERVVTHDLMLRLVAAGYGIGFSSAAHLATCRHTDVMSRPLAGSQVVTTYLLRPNVEPSDILQRFMERVSRIGALPDPPFAGDVPAPS